jgi:hypothetical protein
METFSSIWNWFINETNILIKGLSIPIVVTSIYKTISLTYRFINEIREKRSLFPYYDYKVIRESKRNYIRTKCQNIDPANEINYKSSYAFSTKEDLLAFFLKKVFSLKENENRFYLILGDSGMGKSTFLLNLFSRYNSFLNFKLSKMSLKLLPLGENFNKIKEEIITIEYPKKTILLLDGFDEIPLIENESIKAKFDEIIELVREFKTVIITCRTHFFSSEKEEPFELKIKRFNTEGNGYHIVKKLYISPFDQKDVSKYIHKTFSFYEIANKRKAFNIIENTYDLMVRPMLLSYIKEIIEADKKNLKTGFDIYEALIVNWLNRESNKYELDKRMDFRLNLIFFSYEVSKYIYNNYEKNGIYIPLEEAQKISNEFKINLNDIEIKSRSLLNRNSQGNYKFSHKSIYEFFLAYLAFINRKYNSEIYTVEYNLENYDQAKKFIEDIIKTNRVQFAIPNVDDSTIKYNVELYEQIVKVKNNVKQLQIKWLNGNSFKIIRQKKIS